MQRSFKVIAYDKITNTVKLKLHETLNIERIQTYYNDDLSNVQGLLIIDDPRKATSKQRKLYRALLNDIYYHFGNSTDSSHDYFKEEYFVKYGTQISTKNNTSNSVEDMNNLIEIVMDFMFEWGVPFKHGYELIPRNESYFYYLCIKHRKCCICYKQADICHVDVVGMGRNRNSIDHSDFSFYAGCRIHHQEEHTMGTSTFLSEYKITPIKLDAETRKKLGIGG